MKTLAAIALIMVFGLSGCACCKNSTIKQAWTDFWHEPASGNWKYLKHDWAEFWHDPTAGNWKYMKQDVADFWHDPGGGTWDLIKWSWRQWTQECPFP